MRRIKSLHAFCRAGFLRWGPVELQWGRGRSFRRVQRPSGGGVRKRSKMCPSMGNLVLNYLAVIFWMIHFKWLSILFDTLALIFFHLIHPCIVWGRFWKSLNGSQAPADIILDIPADSEERCLKFKFQINSKGISKMDTKIRQEVQKNLNGLLSKIF